MAHRKHQQAAEWYADRRAIVESAISTAVQRTSSFQPEEPISHLAHELISILTNDDNEFTEDDSPRILALRQALQKIAVAERSIMQTLKRLVPKEIKVSRAGYLRSLREILGPCPGYDWQLEWAALLLEVKQINGEVEQKEDGTWRTVKDFNWAGCNVSSGTMIDKTWIEEHENAEALLRDEAWVYNYTRNLIEFGWSNKDAVTVTLLGIVRTPLARALKEGSTQYAASTYALCDTLAIKCAEQERRGIGKPMSYRTLYGERSLSREDPAWLNIENPDSTGFCGVYSCNVVKGIIDSNVFTADGMKMWNLEQQTNVVVDSPIVGFESAPEDDKGYHSPIALEQISDEGDIRTEYMFPLNCLYRLKSIKNGFVAPNGIYVKQKLIVVTATYRSPLPKPLSTSESSSKLCGSTNTLSYGDRQSFVDGLDALITSQPPLTLAQEFDRDDTWVDWKGNEYSLRNEWLYVTGPAQLLEGCTPGTRDAGNTGRTVDDFCKIANDHIELRRSQGYGLNLGEQAAFLTREEVLAVRLYSGPSFMPINTFLRQVASVSGRHREALASHPLHTFGATCHHLTAAIRKLAAVATKEEASAKVYRGVRGELKSNFWVKDEVGLICAVDTAFMSCSINRNTPIEYMSTQCGNVLWEIQCALESDVSYHSGADISLLSQFSQECEVLFPPCTMLSVNEDLQRQRIEENGRIFETVFVKPSFI